MSELEENNVSEVQEEQVEIEKSNQQTDEEKKNQIIEKYVARKNFKNKVGLLVGVCGSLVLAIAVIIVACLQFSVLPKFLQDNQIDRFEITLNGTSQTPFNRENQEFKNIKIKFQNAFSLSLMSAIFTDQTGNFFLDEDTNKFQESSLSSYVGGNNYIKVQYTQEQKIKNNDGSLYQSYRNPPNNLTYNAIYVGLQSENEFKDVIIVIPVYGSYSGNDQTVAMLAKITVNANLYNFTQYLTELLDK